MKENNSTATIRVRGFILIETKMDYILPLNVVVASAFMKVSSCAWVSYSSAVLTISANT
jgi:hypothetical protein